ncbi:hypothetical protein ACJX0J_024961, partial [Zea mays]
ALQLGLVCEKAKICLDNLDISLWLGGSTTNTNAGTNKWLHINFILSVFLNSCIIHVKAFTHMQERHDDSTHAHKRL